MDLLQGSSITMVRWPYCWFFTIELVIPLDVSYISFLLKVWSKGRSNSLLTSHSHWIPSFTRCFTAPYLKQFCLFLLLNILFLAVAIVASQARCIDTEGVEFVPNKISAKTFFNHSTLLQANSRAINSYSIVDLKIMVCFADFQVTASPPKVNSYSLVDFCVIWI